jgi:radical SAM protein with 4Fe4S-binding SPASM domain
LGCAVITSPSDFSGRIPNVAAAEMAGPKRRPCQSLWNRLAVLSDGTIASCEQDVTGMQKLGSTLQDAWQHAEELRRDHQASNWVKHPACANCKQWHRS